MADSTYLGTNDDEIFDGPEFINEYTNIDLKGGNDTVYLASSQTFVSGPGDDTVIGAGKSDYALWYANEQAYVNLEEGYASDGFGGTDTLSGIDTIHMTLLGGTVIGSSSDELIYCWGGESYYDLGYGNDTVNMYQMNSSEYEVELRDHSWFLQGTDHLIEIHNTEKVIFEDKTYTTPAVDLVPYTRYKPYIFDAKTGGTTFSWHERLDIDNNGLTDIIYYSNSSRTWSSTFEILPEAYLQVLLQQEDGSWCNQTDAIIRDSISPLTGSDITLGDFNGDGTLDFVLPGTGLDPYEDGIPTGNVNIQYGEPDIFYLSQSDGTWECSAPIDRNVWSHNITVSDINLDGLDDTFSSSVIGGFQDLDPSRSFFSMGDEDGTLYADQLTLPSWLTGQSQNEHYIKSNGQEFYSDDSYTGSLLFDVNGDHAADLLVLPSQRSKTSILLLNDGTGDFSESEVIELPYGPYGPSGISVNQSIENGSIMLEAVGLDIDRDGDNDFVSVSTITNIVDGNYIDFYSGTRLQVLLNDGNGHFTVDQTIELLPTNVSNFNYYYTIEVYDLNRDGFPDIVAQSDSSLTDRYNTSILINENGVLNDYTSKIIPNLSNDFIPIHINGELGFVELFDTWYGNDTRDDAALVTTTFTLLESQDYEVGHTIAGGTDTEQHIGSPENDAFIWSWGSDVFNGLDGIDTLVVPGNLTEIDITANTNNTALTFGYETVYMTSIERINAQDKSLAFDLEGTAGNAYRIYQAAFDRTPDLEGLGYWISKMDSGMTLEGVSNSFIESAEFIGLYGENTSDDDFLTLLYNNVLHRDPDAGGYAYWMNEFNTGIISQTGALASFSESAENKANVEDVIAQGIEYVEYGSLIV